MKSKVFRAANPAVMRSLRSAYIGRKIKRENIEGYGLLESMLVQE